MPKTPPLPLPHRPPLSPLLVAMRNQIQHQTQVPKSDISFLKSVSQFTSGLFIPFIGIWPRRIVHDIAIKIMAERRARKRHQKEVREKVDQWAAHKERSQWSQLEEIVDQDEEYEDFELD
ncbi:hypothetical protein BGX27_003786 [Mortierella sp. AM989]|nr:hypothetical protein BGX27_003786 [Mortierella sp. AM989]